MAPRREDSSACSDIPWKVIGDLLFEMGASWVSVSSDRATTGNAPFGRNDEMVGNRLVTADGGTITFVVDGERDVRALLETACSLSGSSDCLDGSVREVIDYGTGSGVLATAAALLGAEHVTAVDLDSEVLAHAGQNFLINGVGKKVTALHTRDVSAGDLAAEVVVANMMAGPMLSQMAVLVLAVNEGGVMCLSGLRPGDVPKIKREFGKYLEWDGELESAKDVSPWGEYVRLVGRPKPGLREGGSTRTSLEKDLSEMAIA